MEIYNDDCLNILPTLPHQSIDLILTDLPYGTTNAKWDCQIPLNQLWIHYNNLIKPNGTIALFATQPFTSQLINSNIKNFKYCWYWHKTSSTGFLNAKKQPLRNIEEICIFYKKQNNYFPIMTQLDKPKSINLNSKPSTLLNKVKSTNETIKYKLYTHNYPKNILTFKKDKKNFHPTQKPLELLKYLIQTYTKENDTILDNTMGAGNTLIAAKQLNRNAIGIEINPTFFNVAKQRINSQNY